MYSETKKKPLCGLLKIDTQLGVHMENFVGFVFEKSSSETINNCFKFGIAINGKTQITVLCFKTTNKQPQKKRNYAKKST